MRPGSAAPAATSRSSSARHRGSVPWGWEKKASRPSRGSRSPTTSRQSTRVSAWSRSNRAASDGSLPSPRPSDRSQIGAEVAEAHPADVQADRLNRAAEHDAEMTEPRPGTAGRRTAAQHLVHRAHRQSEGGAEVAPDAGGVAVTGQSQKERWRQRLERRRSVGFEAVELAPELNRSVAKLRARGQPVATESLDGLPRRCKHAVIPDASEEPPDPVALLAPPTHLQVHGSARRFPQAAFQPDRGKRRQHADLLLEPRDVGGLDQRRREPAAPERERSGQRRRAPARRRSRRPSAQEL